MNKNLILILVVAVILGGLFVYKTQFLDKDSAGPKKVVNEINRPDIYLSFKYNVDADRYNLSQTNADVGVVDGYMRAGFVLMNKEEFEASKGQSGTEGTKSISVFVFENTSGTSSEETTRDMELRKWAETNDPITGFNRKLAEPGLLEFDSVDTLHYVSDGLYQNDTYLASYRGLIYLFIGQFDSQQDAIYKDFQKLMASVSFL